MTSQQGLLGTLAKHYRFVGRRVTMHLALSAFVGVTLFCVELAFAYGLQLFLLVLGVANANMLQMPHWFPPVRIGWVLGFLTASSVVRGVCIWAQDYLRGASLERFKFEQRLRLLEWTFHSRSASTNQVIGHFGERSNHAAGVVKYLQILLVQATTNTLFLASLIYLSPALTLSSVGILLGIAFALKRLSSAVRTAGIGLAHEWDRTQERLVLSIRNLLLLRIYGLESQEKECAQKYLGSHFRHSLTFYRNAGFLSVLPQVVGVLLICGIAYGAKSTVAVPPGRLLAYFYLFIRFLQNASGISYSLSNLIFEWPQYRGLMKWWEDSSPDFDSRSSGLAAAQSSQGRAAISTPIGWQCSKVGFIYPNTTSEVIQSFDIEVRPGSALVVLGPSGAGKSTLLNLLLGELTPTQGDVQIEFEGRKHTLDEAKSRLLRSIGYVGPESFLVEGTILQSLTYGLDGKPDPKELEDAIRRSECQFIYDLPKGLEHYITDQGQGLSAGQKQRLSLARALLRKPRALILDEATANLDMETESKLVDTLAELKGQMTIIGVTHRQGLLKIADQICRLDRVTK